jgi:hypothetical protein
MFLFLKQGLLQRLAISKLFLAQEEPRSLTGIPSTLFRVPEQRRNTNARRRIGSGENGLQIEKHDKSYIVKLEDGSSWRVWPGDIALTLGWSSMTVLEVSEIDDEFCSHALVDKIDGSRVRVIKASKDWPVQQVLQSMKKG